MSAYQKLDEWQSANVSEIERGFVINAATPSDLVEALSKAASEGEQAWRTRPKRNGDSGV